MQPVACLVKYKCGVPVYEKLAENMEQLSYRFRLPMIYIEEKISEREDKPARLMRIIEGAPIFGIQVVRNGLCYNYTDKGYEIVDEHVKLRPMNDEEREMFNNLIKIEMSEKDYAEALKFLENGIV